MRILYILVLLGLIVFGGIRDANAMRCDKQLIKVGDTVGKLTRLCGKPLDYYSDIFRQKEILTYKIYGREIEIIVINGRIRSGV